MRRYRIISVGPNAENEYALVDRLNDGDLKEWKISAILPDNSQRNPIHRIFLEHISVANETVPKNPHAVE